MKSQAGATATLTYKVVDKNGKVIERGNTTGKIEPENPKQSKKED